MGAAVAAAGVAGAFGGGAAAAGDGVPAGPLVPVGDGVAEAGLVGVGFVGAGEVVGEVVAGVAAVCGFRLPVIL